MAKWNVTVESGRRRKRIRVEAATANAARLKAQIHGDVVMVVVKPPLFVRKGLNRRERAIWLVRISAMLESKLPASEAIRLIASTFGGRIKRASDEVMRNIETGMTLVEAIEADTRDFPPSLGALIRAGSTHGDTAIALRDAAKYESRMAEANKGSMRDVWKALLMFVFGGAMIIAGTDYLAPMILKNGLFKDKGFDFTWIDRVGTWSMVAMYAILGFFAVLILLGSVGRKVFPVTADSIILKVPVYKDVVMARSNHVNLYRLSLLISTGMMDEEALATAARDATPGIMQRDLRRAREEMRRGQPWARSMTILHPTDRAAIEISHSREDKARTLTSLSEQYDEIFRQRVGFLGPLIATLGAIFMTYATFLMFAQTMFPLMQLLSGISSK